LTEALTDLPETRFIGLMSELFQLREAEELDFGIYRVIKRHNRQVRAFLGEIVEENGQPVLRGGELAGILEQAFQQIDSETRNERKAQLQCMADGLGIKTHWPVEEREQYLIGVEKIPAMRQQVVDYRNLREELESTYSATADRSETLNRLYEFFSRHYQDGDFIVQRRYGRNGARYIKSSGEDTEFHWATEGMYYIKSGDVFTDYPVRLSNGRHLVFCVDAETLHQTRAELKPTDKASYKLRAIQETDGVIRVTLEYLKGAQKIRAQFDEIASQAAALSKIQPDEIARHLRRYIARNQSDFFIHKRLQEALDDDLDIFLKTDVLSADQLLADDAGHIPARALRVARAIRRIGRRINAFLGVLEDYRKRLWEKKKLVLSTRYVITLDRLDKLAGRAFVEANLAAILANAAQVAEWQALGLGELATVEAIRREDGGFLPLPVDTLHFGEDFKWALLAAVTKDHPLDESLDGVAIHSDNWQALNTMQEKYGERVKCVYIDPPYNTGGDGFPYKDAFKHASWMAMIGDRLYKAARLIQPNGAIFTSIDANERKSLEIALDYAFSRQNRVEEIIWIQNSTKSQSPTYSNNHEYVEVYCRDLDTVKRDEKMFREPKPGYAEIMELIESLNPQYPSVVEIKKKDYCLI
jgi:adenine-specific DNA-methyltransferase